MSSRVAVPLWGTLVPDTKEKLDSLMLVADPSVPPLPQPAPGVKARTAICVNPLRWDTKNMGVPAPVVVPASVAGIMVNGSLEALRNPSAELDDVRLAPDSMAVRLNEAKRIPAYEPDGSLNSLAAM